MAEPILTWAGGKRHMLKEITRRLPPKGRFDTYYEPFFGGGAVFFDIEPENGYINDINSRLINFYQQLREQPERIIGENKQIDDRYSRADEDGKDEIYYNLRDEFNSLRDANNNCKDEFREAVLLLFLNRTCFNGLYRTNQEGEFNVPQGSGWTRMKGIERRLRKGYKVLQNTTITSKDFSYVEQHVGENDLVFFDPPYPKESKTAKFNEYDPSGFDEDNQVELLETALELDRRGANVMITNGNSAEEIYKQHEDFDKAFRIVGIRGERKINSDETKRRDIGYTDIIATNFSPFIEQKTFENYR